MCSYLHLTFQQPTAIKNNLAVSIRILAMKWN